MTSNRTTSRHDPDPMGSDDVDALRLEILRLRDHLRGSEAKVGELETRIARLDAQRARSERMWINRLEHTDARLEMAEQRVAAMETSTSWRIGQFVLQPVAAWRRAIER